MDSSTRRRGRISPPPEPTFFGLPLEIRRQFYTHIVRHSFNDLLSFLCTCWQVYHEGRDILHQQPLVFCHQDALTAFTKVANRSMFRSIEDITIRVHETDVSKITEYLGIVANKTACSPPATHPYIIEADMISDALDKIGPQIRHLALLRPLGESKTATCDIYQRLIVYIQAHYPKLESLHLDIEKIPLSFLPRLGALKSLHLSGFSVTSATEMLLILKQLRNLDSLQITGPPSHHDFHQRSGYRGQPIVQSLNPPVVSLLRPLSHLSICEFDSPYCTHLTFLTTSMLRAITRTHAPSLKFLSLTSNVSLDNNTQQEIVQLVRSCLTAKHIILAWPGMDITTDFSSSLITKDLPNTIQSLSLLATDNDITLASEYLHILLESRSTPLPYLHHICLYKHHVPTPPPPHAHPQTKSHSPDSIQPQPAPIKDKTETTRYDIESPIPRPNPPTPAVSSSSSSASASASASTTCSFEAQKQQQQQQMPLLRYALTWRYWNPSSSCSS